MAWVEDLEQGLEELSRGERLHHQNELLKDLLQSAQGLLALSESELRKLSNIDLTLLDNATGSVQTVEDIRQLCSRIRRVFRTAGDAPAESTD